MDRGIAGQGGNSDAKYIQGLAKSFLVGDEAGKIVEIQP